MAFVGCTKNSDANKSAKGSYSENYGAQIKKRNFERGVENGA